MGLFSKAEQVEVVLPFTYDDDPMDVEACAITIEAFGQIEGSYKYCYASFDAGIKAYDELSKRLIDAGEKYVRVIVKFKNGKPKDFRIDLKDLAERYGDARFEKLELLGWGMNDKSFRQ